MLTVNQKETLLKAYQALLDNREAIEQVDYLKNWGTIFVDGIKMWVSEGACSFVGNYTDHYCDFNVYTDSNYIEKMNEALMLHSDYPVKFENYIDRGNKWSTTNPTHNAEGRWKYVAKCVVYITEDIESYEA